MSRRQNGVRQEGVLVSEEAPLGPPSYGVKSECCQKGEPLLGPKSRILFNTWKWIVQGDTCAAEARHFISKGSWAESIRVREPRRTGLPCG